MCSYETGKGREGGREGESEKSEKARKRGNGGVGERERTREKERACFWKRHTQTFTRTSALAHTLLLTRWITHSFKTPTPSAPSPPALSPSTPIKHAFQVGRRERGGRERERARARSSERARRGSLGRTCFNRRKRQRTHARQHGQWPTHDRSAEHGDEKEKQTATDTRAEVHLQTR